MQINTACYSSKGSTRIARFSRTGITPRLFSAKSGLNGERQMAYWLLSIAY
jgi:hypothetical protein